MIPFYAFLIEQRQPTYNYEKDYGYGLIRRRVALAIILLILIRHTVLFFIRDYYSGTSSLCESLSEEIRKLTLVNIDRLFRVYLP